MLARSLVREIRRLLAEKRMSRRKIARRFGIHRNTINAIARGRRREPPPPVEEDEPLGPAVRCPECGGLVYGTCRLCRLRRRPVSRPADPPGERFAAIDGPLGLELKPRHQIRYEEVRARRAREELSQDIDRS